MLTIRRALLALALVIAGAFIATTPAYASLCKDAPAPTAPKAGLPGLLSAPPTNIPAEAPDPFADPTIPIGDVYGYNWQWSNYDLGCGSDFLQDPIAVSNTAFANTALSVADGTLAALASLDQAAKTDALEWLSSTLNSLAKSLKDPVLRLWFPVTTVALGIYLVWRAKHASYHEVAKAAAVFVAALALAVFALVYPAVLSSKLDKAITSVADITGQAFTASPSDAINRQSVYRVWLTGNFGDADSDVAKKYGPALVAATHYSWSDWRKIQADPGTKDAIDSAKADQFKKVAAGLEKDSPAAYEAFTGRGERTAPALFAIVNVAAMGLFVALASVMVLIARVMMQALTIVAPLVAVVGILPKASGLLAKLWDLFTAAFLAVAKFTLAGGVMTVVLGALQSADVPGPNRLLFVVVATVVGLMITKPVQSIKTLVPGMDPNHSIIKGLVGHIGPALAGGIVAGTVARTVGDQPGAPQDRPQWEQVPDEQVVPRPSHAPSLTPLPAPPLWQQLPAAPVAQEALPAPQATQATPLPAPVVAMPLPAGAPEQRALPAAPIVISSDPTPPQPTVTETPAAPTVLPPSPSTPTIVEPTGIIETTGQYHAGGPVHEYLVPRTELELADDGTEHERIVYHSRQG